MSKKIKVEIKVTNEYGQESIETYHGDYDTLHGNEWDEITRGLLDEAVSTKEL